MPVVPEFMEPEVVPVVPELVEPGVVPVVPEFIEPEVVPVLPELVELVLPAVPVLLVVLPGEVAFGFAVEPEFTAPLLLFTPGPELADDEVPPVEPELLPVPLPDWA